MFKFLDDKSQTASEFRRGYNHEKNITRHMRIQTRRQILFACEFCEREVGAKRRNKYENTANRRNNMKIGITRKRSGKSRKRDKTRINERTKRGSSRRTVFPVEIPITINYIVIKSRCSRTPNRLTETSAAAATTIAFFHFADDPKGNERTD